MTRHRRSHLTATSALLALIMTGISPPAVAQDEPTVDPASASAPDRSYSLVVKPARRVKAELTILIDTPDLAAQEWVVYAAQLPTVPGQTGVSSTLLPGGQAARESSEEHRPILRARLNADKPDRRHGLNLRMEYQATLLSRRLVRGRGGEESSPVPPLDAREMRDALAAGGLFDFHSDDFGHWLDENKLRLGAAEGEIDFGRRVFLAVKRGYRYVYRDTLDRHASRVCRGGESDCGGLAVLFASAMRANRVPTRLLVGRWASSSTLVDGQVFNQQHVKAEFFAAGVGWVPADLSSAVLHDRSPEGLAFFGNDDGDFLVMHLDTDLVCDTIHFGRKIVTWLQAPKYWVTGSGTFDKAVTRESWNVTPSPAPELIEATLKKPDPRAKPPRRARPGSSPR